MKEKNKIIFDPRFGKRPARLVGRDDVLRDIRAAIDDADEPGRTMVVTGVKGSGKTALLAEIRAGLGSAQAVSIDLLDDARMDAIGQGEGLRNPAQAAAVYFADDARADRPGLREFLAGYARRAAARENVMLLLAGVPHEVGELLKGGELAFLRRARRAPLGSVRTDEVLSLFEEAFAENGAGADGPGLGSVKGPGAVGAGIANSALLRAAEATAGYPYLIQLVGYYLSKNANRIDGKAADKAIFLAKIELYKNIHEPQVWSLSSKDRVFLWAMAQDDGPSEFGDIAKRMDVSAGYASKYRERLINAGMIYRSAYGELSFQMPYMKEYIEKEYIERLGGEGRKRRL
ncbi:MAG: ATP-binding protein [Clostridiales Family XIII bacterium]|jgi:hypothetical protein|nr:ATP-binding protein [Clostridiales Family XIII bacterium]